MPLAANTASVAHRIRATSSRISAIGCLSPCAIGVARDNTVGRHHWLTGDERSWIARWRCLRTRRVTACIARTMH
jgi:hypothetical protein